MKKYLFGAIIFLSLTAPAQWTHTKGPYGIAVQSLTSMGGKLYAAQSAGGVYCTSLNAIKWENKSTGLTSTNHLTGICTLNNMLIVVGNQGVFISTDEGTQWQAANSGLSHLDTKCVYIKGQDVFIGTGIGVFKSSDLCNSWTLASTGIPDSQIYGFMELDTSFFAVGNMGIFRSEDNGDTWTNSSEGISNPNIQAITKIGNTLYVLTNNAVYKSLYNGNTWIPTNGNPPYNQANSSLFAVNETLFLGKMPPAANGYGKLCRSTDQGLFWTPATTGISKADNNIGFPTYFCHTLRNDTIYVGSTLGVHWSADNGSTWHGIGLGGGGNVNAIAIDANDLYCGTKNGIYKSTDTGDSWYLIDNGLPSNTSVLSILKHNNTLFIGTFGKGIYRSNDNGISWSNDNNALVGLATSSMITIGNTIYAGTRYGGGTNQRGVYKSTDNGLTWQAINNGLPSTIAVHSITYNGEYIFIGTDKGIFQSNNLGSAWTEANNGLMFNMSHPINAVLAVGQTVFAGQTYGGSSNLQYIGGVSTSDNAGASWWHNYYMDYSSVTSLFQSGSAIYAGCLMTTNSIFKSNDLGQTWTVFTDGLATSNINTINGNEHILLAGGRGSGVWKYHLNTSGTNPDLSPETTIQLFPNPTQDNLEVTAIDAYQYTIFNTQGQKVASGEINKNSNSISVSALPLGSYIMQFQNEQRVFSKSFVKM